MADATKQRVVVIPGMLGSALSDPQVETGRFYQRVSRLDPRQLWGKPGMSLWMPFPTQWRDRMLQGNGLDDPGTITPDGFVSLPGADPYGPLMKRLQHPAVDALAFPYDWRLSCHINARRLREAIVQRWFADEKTPAPLERVIVVAHSMGGLIARMVIEGNDGFRWIKHLITGGTPHVGAPVIYTHYHDYSTSFYQRLDLGNVKWLLGRVLPGLSQAIPGRLYLPTVMPRAMQNELTRATAGGLQLVPRFPFVVRHGSYEPVDETLRELTHAPTGKNARQVIDLLLAGLRDETRLNAWLDAMDIRYTTLAGAGRQTLQAYDADRKRMIRTPGGDGVVPLRSAHLPQGARIANITLQNVEHQAIWRDSRAQDEALRAMELAV